MRSPPPDWASGPERSILPAGPTISRIMYVLPTVASAKREKALQVHRRALMPLLRAAMRMAAFQEALLPMQAVALMHTIQAVAGPLISVMEVKAAFNTPARRMWADVVEKA